MFSGKEKKAQPSPRLPQSKTAPKHAIVMLLRCKHAESTRVDLWIPRAHTHTYTCTCTNTHTWRVRCRCVLWSHKGNWVTMSFRVRLMVVAGGWAVIGVEGRSKVRHRCRFPSSSLSALSQLTASSLYHHRLLFQLHSIPPTHAVLSNLYTSNHLCGWAASSSCTDVLTLFLLPERTHPQDVVAISGSLTLPIIVRLTFSFARMTHFWC